MAPTKRDKADNIAKRKAFAKFYVRGVPDDIDGPGKKRNGTAAAIAAGYSPDNAASQASHLLKRQDVQDMIAEEEGLVLDGVKYNEDFILEGLLKVYERCMMAEPVIVAGAPTGDWTFNANGALKALDALGRHIGMWQKMTDDSGAREAMEGAKKRADEAAKRLSEINQGIKDGTIARIHGNANKL